MSQLYKNLAAGPVPPTVATTYVTDVNSPAVPAANVLDIIGGQTTANNLNGIQTDGSSESNIITIQLTNRVQGAVSTNNATPTNAITFPLGATPGVYTLDGLISAFDTTDTAGAGYFFSSSVRTTGAAGVEIGTEFTSEFEEAAMMPADVAVIVSGNNLLIQVTGIAGKAIDWLAQFTYTFIG